MTALLSPSPAQWAVYVHFPFCIHRCSYCDFATVAATVIPRERALAATLREFELRTEALEPAPIRSIFFGGGTPSLWGPAAIGSILGWLDRWAGIDADAEITLEANPGAAEAGDLRAYADAGVTRISLGVQATEDARLAALDRIHDGATALRTVETLAELCAQGRLGSVSADLLFGAPGQDHVALERDVRALADRGLPHLSAYALTVESETPLGQMVARGIRNAPDEGLQAEMLEAVPSLLAPYGLSRYEVSNFALPGHESRHNLAYWRGDHYLSVGVGAHGFLPTPDDIGVRYANTRSIGAWFAAIEGGELAETLRETIDAEQHTDELLLTGLRLAEGVDLERLAQRVGAATATQIRAAARRYGTRAAGRRADGGPVVYEAAGRLHVAREAMAHLDSHVVALALELEATRSARV